MQWRRRFSAPCSGSDYSNIVAKRTAAAGSASVTSIVKPPCSTECSLSTSQRMRLPASDIEDSSIRLRLWRAAQIEGAVVDSIRDLLRSPEMIVRTWRAGKRLVAGLDESEVRAALKRLDPVWNELFPAEQARVVQLLVERVDVSPDGVEIRLRTEGLAHLTAELDAVRPENWRAA